MAGSCRGAYLAIFTRFWGLTRTTGTKGVLGITGVIGTEGVTVWDKIMCVGEEGMGGEL